jgi:hypothetical protein
MPSRLQIKLASKTIADQHYHFELVGVVVRITLHDDCLHVSPSGRTK